MAPFEIMKPSGCTSSPFVTMSSLLRPVAHPSWITRRVDNVCAVVVVRRPSRSRDHGCFFSLSGIKSCVSTSMATMASQGISFSVTYVGAGFTFTVSERMVRKSPTLGIFLTFSPGGGCRFATLQIENDAIGCGGVMVPIRYRPDSNAERAICLRRGEDARPPRT